MSAMTHLFQVQDDGQICFINKFISVFQKNRLIVSLLHIFLDILSPRIWPNDHKEVNERMKEVLMMEWFLMQVVGVWHYLL